MKFVIFFISLLAGGAVHYLTTQNEGLLRVEEAVFKEVTQAVFSLSHFSEVGRTNEGEGFAQVRFYEKHAKSSLLSYELNDAQKGIFESSPLSASDWAVVIHNLEQRGVHRVAAQAVMSWDEGKELELSALDAGLSHAQRAVVGVHYRRISSQQTLPTAFQESAIPRGNLQGKIQLLPEVNEAVFPPSTTGAQGLLYGFLSLESEEEPTLNAQGEIKLPMLARWGDRLLPSWPLAVAMAQAGVKAEEVKGALGGDLFLGKGGLVIKLDEFGRATFPQELTSATEPPLIRTDLSQLLSANYQVEPEEGQMAVVFDRSQHGGKIDYLNVLNTILNQARLGDAVHFPLIIPWAGVVVLLNLALISSLLSSTSPGNRWLGFPLLLLGCFLVSTLVVEFAAFWLPVLPLLSVVMVSFLLSFTPKAHHKRRSQGLLKLKSAALHSLNSPPNDDR